MLYHLLDDDQKNAFFVLANKLAMADGEDSMEEAESLGSLKAELGGGVEAPMERVLAAVDVSAFASRSARVIAMLELLCIAYADEYMHEAEADLVGEIAESFGFTQTELDAMAMWAGRALEQRRRPTAEGERALAVEAKRLMRE
jgi:uncharacterized tellurite resistance protein B-like protein